MAEQVGVAAQVRVAEQVSWVAAQVGVEAQVEVGGSAGSRGPG